MPASRGQPSSLVRLHTSLIGRYVRDTQRLLPLIRRQNPQKRWKAKGYHPYLSLTGLRLPRWPPKKTGLLSEAQVRWLPWSPHDPPRKKRPRRSRSFLLSARIRLPLGWSPVLRGQTATLRGSPFSTRSLSPSGSSCSATCSARPGAARLRSGRQPRASPPRRVPGQLNDQQGIPTIVSF